MPRRFVVWAPALLALVAVGFILRFAFLPTPDVRPAMIASEAHGVRNANVGFDAQSQQENSDDAGESLRITEGLAEPGTNQQDRARNIAKAAHESSAGGPGDKSSVASVQDHSVVGRQFAISPSVKLQCQANSLVERPCEYMEDFLAEMASEPREVSWANSAEVRLEKSIVQNEPPIYEIRSVECRTTRCAVEVWAREEPWDGMLDNDPQLSYEFGQVRGRLGFETSPEGERIVVTLMTFRRR